MMDPKLERLLTHFKKEGYRVTVSGGYVILTWKHNTPKTYSIKEFIERYKDLGE